MRKDLRGSGGGGGGSSSDFTQTPDNLRSEDLFEGLLGLGIGPWKGPVRGMKSITINGTPLEDEGSTDNFPGWVVNFANGDPALWPQKPNLVLGQGASPTSVNLPLANTTGTGIPVVRTVANTGASYIDLRFVASQMYHQTDSGIFNITAHIKIRMKPSGHTGWIEVLADTTSTEPQRPYGGLLSAANGVSRYVAALFFVSGAFQSARRTTGIVNGQLTISGKTTSPAVKEVRIAVPNTGNYLATGWDIECTLMEKDTFDNDPVSDRRIITWESASAVFTDTSLGADPEWKGQSWMSVYGPASDRINSEPTVQGVFDTKVVSVPPGTVYDPIARRYTGTVWDGSWTKSYTNDPAWVINDALADPIGGISAISQGSYLNKWDALDLSKYCSQLVPSGRYNQTSWVAGVTDQVKAYAVIALTTNVNIASPGATLDGRTMVAADRVVLAGQTTASQNGIYVWNGAAVAMTRATDMDAAAECLGATVYVTAGTWAEEWFKQCQTVTTIGTNAIQWCAVQPRYSLNCYFTQPQKADEFIQNLAGAVGAATWDIGGGEWRCKSDKISNPVAIFTEQNIEGEFVYSHTDMDARFNDVTLTFRNSDFDYREDRVRVFDQTNIDTFGRRPTTVAAIGCTDRQEAIRRAMLRLRTSMNEFRIVTFTTNRQGRFVGVLENILVADQSLGYTVPTGSTFLANTDSRDSTTGRIIGLDATRKIITLRDALRLEPGATYSIVVTIPNPNYTPSPSTAPSSADWDKPTITVEYPLSSGTARGDVTTLTTTVALDANVPNFAPLALKAVGLPSLPKTYRVIDITASDDTERVNVTAIEVDTGKYDAADNANYQSISAQMPSLTCPPPTAPTTGILSVSTFASAYAFNRVLNIDWVRPGSVFITGYEVKYSFNDGPKVTLNRTTDTRVEIPNPQFGNYNVEIVAIDRRGQKSQPLTAFITVSESALFRAVGYLTNEAQIVPADNTGAVTSYSGASGLFKVFIGTSDVTAGCTFAVTSNPAGLTGPYTGSSPVDTTGAYSVTGGMATGTSTATITIRATHTVSGFTVDKVFTLTKATAGANGLAKAITLSTSHFTFQYASGSTAPNTQTTTITANRINAGGDTTLWNVYKADGSTVILSAQTAAQLQTAGYCTAVSNDQITITETQFDAKIVANSTTGLVFRAYYAGATTTYDQITIIKVSDGVNALSTYLTNPAMSVATDSVGSGGVYTSAGGSMKVFYGGVDVTASCTFSVQSTTGGLTSGTNVTINSTTGVYAITGLTADNGTAVFRATYGSRTGDSGYSISKAKQGAAAKLLYVSGDRQMVSYDGTGALSPSLQPVNFTIYPQGLSSTSYTITMFKSDGTQINANTYLTALSGSFGASGNAISWTGGGTQFTMTSANFNTARAATNGIYVTVTHADGVTDTMSVMKTADGATGTAGLNNAQVFLYQRSASTPSVPSVSTTYTFSTGGLATPNNGWSQVVPAPNGNPLYVTVATASSNTATDPIAAAEWASPSIMASEGINAATIFLYQRASSLPSVPSATVTYTFGTGGLSGVNNGWLPAVPAANGFPLYVTTATALGSGTSDTIATGEWSTVRVLAQDSKLINMSSDRQLINYDTTGVPNPSTQPTTYTIIPQNLSTGSYTISMFKADGTTLNANTYLTAVSGSFGASGNAISWTGSGTQFTLTAANFNTARGTGNGVIIKISHADGVSDQMLLSKTGAVWGTDLSGVPVNLAALVGSEAINNLAILNTIANDDILSASEKITQLIPMYADLEARYVDLVARATALGLDTSGVATARANWQALLASYSPAWNNTTQDTSIYTGWFPDHNFPAGWALDGTTAANAPYTTLIDSVTTNTQNIFRQKSQTGNGVLYSFGVSIKKDSVGAATRWPLVRFFCQGTTFKYGDIAIDTKTGDSALGGSGFGGLALTVVLDRGDDWYVVGSITSHEATAVTVGVQIFPAFGVGVGFTGGVNNTVTGSIDMRAPDAVAGDWKKLGRNVLTGILNAYSAQITKLAQAISQLDSATSYTLADVLSSYNFAYNYDGTKNYTTQNVTAHLKNQNGASILTGVTWKYVVMTGTVNGNAADGVTEFAMTVDTGDAYIPVTSLGSNSNKVEIRAYVGSQMWPKQAILNKVFASAPAGGGGGGSGSLSVTAPIGNSVSDTTQVVVCSLSGTTPTGVTSVTLHAEITISDISGSKSGSCTVQAKFQRLIGSTWTDVSGGSGAGLCKDLLYEPQDGSITLSCGNSGLSASTAYQWRIIAWRSAGTDTANLYGTATVTG